MANNLDKSKVKCLDCKNIFWNAKKTTNAYSYIFRHLLKTGHQSVQICKNSMISEFGIVECSWCDCRNVFKMSIVFPSEDDMELCCDKCQKGKRTEITHNDETVLANIADLPSEKVIVNNAINQRLVALKVRYPPINIIKPPIQTAKQANLKIAFQPLLKTQNIPRKTVSFGNITQPFENLTIHSSEPDIVSVQNVASSKGEIKCLHCLQKFSNERPRAGKSTNIIRHLKKRYHFEIELSLTESKTCLQKLECLNCDEKNVFTLQFVEVGLNYMVLCNSCVKNQVINMTNTDSPSISLKTCKSTPIVLDGAINSLLVDIKVAPMIQTDQDIQPDNYHDEEDSDEDDIEIIYSTIPQIQPLIPLKEKQIVPVQYNDVTSYLKNFNALLGIESKENHKQANNLNFEADAIILQNNLGNHSHLKVGRELKLRYNNISSGCWIRENTDNQIRADSKHSSDSQSDSRGSYRRVNVKGVYPQYVFERIQKGLKTFQHLSESLQRAIIGEQIQSNSDSPLSPLILRTTVDQVSAEYQSLNESQINAIVSSLKERVSLIQGPPGTGKTETAACLVARLCQERNYNSNLKILVCSPSNLAADNLTYRIHNKEPRIKIQRIVSKYRQEAYDSYPDKYRDIILHKAMQRYSNSAKNLIENAQVICTTCINAVDKKLANFSFDIVVIDESNQAIEPECLIPLQKGATKLILIGDHKQLPPMVSSVVAGSKGLKRSMFQRLVMARSKEADPHSLEVLFLSRQYRMHPAISRVSSTIFYAGKLEDAVTAEEREPVKTFEWINKKKPLQFYHVEGYESTLQDGRSYMNVAEATQVALIYRKLIISGVKAEDIGVISAYSSQVKLIKELIENKDVLVETVHSFQGKEKEYIIMSCVRSNNYQDLGIVRSAPLINVSITRARRGLLIVGNRHHLIHSKWWKQVLQFFQEDGLFVNLQLSTTADESLKEINIEHTVLVKKPIHMKFTK